MPLDERGDIAAAEIAFYVPFAVISLVLTIRHGFTRDAGFIFLFIFGLIRTAAGALTVAAQLVEPSNIDLFIVAYLFFPAGLAFLMMAVLGFMGMAGQNTYSDYTRTVRMLRLVGLLCITALALSIAGGLLGTHVNPDVNTGMILRRVAAGVYGGAYLLTFILWFVFLPNRYIMRRYRRTLFFAIFVGLLFLGVRVAYGILAAWSSSDPFYSSLSSNPTLARFSPFEGREWWLYLAMGLIMEFGCAAILLLFSTILYRRHYRH